jgi:hypothetical protein
VAENHPKVGEEPYFLYYNKKIWLCKICSFDAKTATERTRYK